MLEEVRLIRVMAGENMNRFYHMIPGGSEFTVHWGRVGSKGQRKTYSSSQWDKKYNEKLKKGYLDITEQSSVSSDTMPEDDTDLDALFRFLKDQSQSYVRQNVLADTGSVTRAQICECQQLLDSFRGMVARGASIFALNSQLEAMWSVVPRKMKDLREERLDKIGLAVGRADYEQDLLDALQAQAKMADSSGQRLSEMYGMELNRIDDRLSSILSGNFVIRDYQGVARARAVRLWSVQYLDSSFVDGDDTRVFFHSSRARNWLSIFNTGLLIRPGRAKTSGSRFGHGIYFASDPIKCLSYSDLGGSGGMVHGNERSGILALFKVNIGYQLELRSDRDLPSGIYSRNNLSVDTLRGRYDSVVARKGYDGTHHDEYVVYTENRCALAGLIELVSGR